MLKKGLGIVLFLFLLMSTVYAQESTNQNNTFSQGPGGPGMGAQRNNRPLAPPQAAIDVCTGKSEGTACEVSTPQGTKAGVCAYTPDKKYFACRPTRVPPQFAIDACTGKSEGTACKMSTPEGTKTGVCAYTPDKKYIACRPKDMHKPPQGQQEGQGGKGQ